MHGGVRRYSGGSALADAMATCAHEVQDLISHVPGFRYCVAVRASDDAAGAAESARIPRVRIQKNVPGVDLAALDVTEGEVFLRFGA